MLQGTNLDKLNKTFSLLILWTEKLSRYIVVHLFSKKEYFNDEFRYEVKPDCDFTKCNTVPENL